jgi:serine/threonine-protein kinase
MDEAPQSPVRPGDVLAGKYRVERVLGVGGMGVVVAALHLQLDERVALKFLLQEALANQEAVARFSREARAAVKIKSEHVARVIDVGSLDNGAPYMVMEYLEGQDLSHVLRQRGPLPVEEAVTYVLQACEAIAEAHALGIIHRDLKPSNLFLASRPDGRSIVKVLDFGISKVRAQGGMPDAAMTRTSSVMGSPLYMSPEQMAASRDVDARSDIWSLGAVLYQLLTCTAPFVADTMPELCAKILTSPAMPVRSVRPDVPPELEAIIHRCLEKNRDHRFPTIAHLAAALAPYAPRSQGSVERIARVLDVDPFTATLPPTTEPMPHAPIQQPAWVAGPTQVPPQALGTHAAWGTTGGATRVSSAWPVYLGVGLAGVAAASLVVAVVFLKFSGSSSKFATTTPAAVNHEPVPLDAAPEPADDSALPSLRTPPPPVVVEPKTTAPAATTTNAANPPPPSITIVLPQPPPPLPTATATATHTTDPTATKKPDIF